MQFLDVVKNEHFTNFTCLLRGPWESRAWQNQHNIPVFARINQLSKLVFSDGQISDRDKFVSEFLGLCTDVAKASGVQLTTDDLGWFAATLDGPAAQAIMGLLFACISAPDTMLTPAEVATISGTAESTWRNKAAAGEILGAVKKGKQWLLPASWLLSRGVIAEIPRRESSPEP